MIYTFQKINSNEQILFFAENKFQAEKELSARYGDSSKEYSLIKFVPVEQFNITIY